VDGSDLHEIELPLVTAFRTLADSWCGLGAFVVNQRHPKTPDMGYDDLADWDLGINLPLESVGSTQVDELVSFARSLGQETGRDFWVGVASTGISEDFVSLGAFAGEPERHALLQHLAGR